MLGPGALGPLRGLGLLASALPGEAQMGLGWDPQKTRKNQAVKNVTFLLTIPYANLHFFAKIKEMAFWGVPGASQMVPPLFFVSVLWRKD